MRALKMLPMVLALGLVNCNTDRVAWNSGLRSLSAGVGVNDPGVMDIVLDEVVDYIRSALTVVPGIIVEGPVGRRPLTGETGEADIYDAIAMVSHLPETPWTWQDEFYWFRMEQSCGTCPEGWRLLGVNAEPFPV